MISRQCPECAGELVMARRPDNQPGPAAMAIQSTYWRCGICGGEFTSEQVRKQKGAKPTLTERV